MNNLIKIVLAILLSLCLADMPYGYYQFVRLISSVAFAYLAYLAIEEGKKNEIFIYIVLALLFQPFMKISLGRELWNFVDVVVGLGLIISIFMTKSKAK
jgi:hypothetical protein